MDRSSGITFFNCFAAGTVLPSGLEELLANIPCNKLVPPAESKSPKTPNATKNHDKKPPGSGKRCSNQGTPRTNRQQLPAQDNSGPFFKNNRIYHPSKEVSQIVNDLGLNRVDDTIFPDYMSLEEVNAGLSNGTLIEGSIRINSKNFKDAYISSPVEMEVDILIDGKLHVIYPQFYRITSFIPSTWSLYLILLAISRFFCE